MSTTPEDKAKQDQEFADAWPTDDASTKAEPMAKNEKAFYTTDELEAQALEAKSAAARKGV